MGQNLQIVGTVFFGLALIQTLLGRRIRFLHGEPALIFPFWAVLFGLAILLFEGVENFRAAWESWHLAEPAFVGVTVYIASTRTVRVLTQEILRRAALKIKFVNPSEADYFTLLSLGALLGSFITEPAAMTVLALALKDEFFSRSDSVRLKYKTLGALFVNVSIGGVLTAFAAPPVIMVARTWAWSTPYVFVTFGIRAIVAVVITAALTTWLVRAEISELKPKALGTFVPPTRLKLILDVGSLAAVVLTAHHPLIFLSIFALFLLAQKLIPSTDPKPDYKPAFWVALFLAGLVVLGSAQEFWVAPLLRSLTANALFWGSTALTAVIDNAALTYLGSQVAGLSLQLKVALVAGSVTGGGLTLIANAPNVAGYEILKGSFPERRVSLLRLFLSVVIPTLIAAMAFRLF